ncbi:MAG: hypothetical protein MK132_26920 [Lentisphaerales bacterium]|nr:hypothetical protein [Lentisphaerales bacterium]
MVIGSQDLAVILGITKVFVSLTLIAFGTSLPELSASAMASYKKQTDFCIGNIVASIIFNMGMVLGITAVFSPVIFDKALLSNEFIWLVAI